MEPVREQLLMSSDVRCVNAVKLNIMIGTVPVNGFPLRLSDLSARE